jgi:hypothetical protein
MRVKYGVCKEDLESKSALINHAKRVQETVLHQLLSALDLN